MLTYKAERFSDIADEMYPLIQKHWLEVGRDRDRIKLDVDKGRYEVLEAAGAFLLVTAREGGRLVGYIAAILSGHLHYQSTLFASLDVFWLDPIWRKGCNGIDLFTVFEDELKARGVVKVIGQTKLGKALDISALYKFLGWTPAEMLFTKVL